MMLVGVVLAFAGMASASPIATATTPDKATSVIVGPRRNGYTDLPSSVGWYNGGQPFNAIPGYVTASDSETGFDAIIYNQQEIYTAMLVSANYS
jgi:hypothetical protein